VVSTAISCAIEDVSTVRKVQPPPVIFQGCLVDTNSDQRRSGAYRVSNLIAS
jgi:hypothetical protein